MRGNNPFRKLTFLRLVLALVLPLVLLTPTASPAETNNPAALKKVSFLFQWKHQFQFAGFYVAKEKGYYQQAGLDVEFLEHNLQHDRIKEVIEGRATFSTADSSIVKERLQGVPVVLLSNYFKQSPFAIVTRQKIRLPSDLRGKRFMVTPSDIDSTSLKSMFKQFGMNNEDMILVPHSFNIQDFISGHVDAMSIYMTDQIFPLEQSGVPYSLIDPNNYGVSSSMNLFTSEDYARTHPDTVRAFKQASDRGWVYALEHPDEIIDLILRKYNTQKKVRAAYTFEVRETTKLMLPKVYPVGSIDLEGIKRVAEGFVQNGDAKSLDQLEGMIFDVEVSRRNNEGRSKGRIILSAEEQAYLKAHPVIRIGNEQDAPPFAFTVGGQPQGFSIDLLNLLASRIGFKPEYVISPAEELLQMQRDGKLNLLHSLGRNPELEKSGHYSESYFYMKTVFVTRKNEPDIANFGQLKDKTVAVGPAQEDFLKQFDPQIKRLPQGTIEQRLEAILRSEADTMIENDATVSYWLHRKGIRDLKMSGWAKALDKGRAQSLHFYAQQDAPQLISILNKALATLPPGELVQLQSKWFGSNAGVPLNQQITLSPLQQNYLARKKAITMCVDPNWMPVERITKEGVHEGMAADMISKVARQLGTDIVLVPTKNWQESLDFAKARRCDIWSAAADTPSRRKTMDFTAPYISFSNVIITNNKQGYFSDIESFIGERFGVVKGYALIEQLKTRYPGILLVEVANIREGLDLVQQGKLFGFIDALPTVSYVIQTQGLFDLKVAGQLPDKWELSIATRNDEPLLRGVLQAAIKAVPPEERQAVIQQWTAVRFESVTDYDLLFKILGVVMLVVGMVLYSNRRLTKLNRALGIAKKEAQQSEHEIKAAHQTLISTLDDLRTTQTQLIDAEKRASLSQLVANVAHELNSPFGAVKSSGQMIATSLDETIHQFPKLILMLNATERELFIRLVSHRQAGILTSRERRTLVLDLAGKLKHAGISQARPKAETLVALLAHTAYEEYLPLLKHPACDIILKTASVIGDINNGANIIGNAVDRASKIVTTLNSFAHTDVGGVMGVTDIQEGIETILGIYRNQIMQNTELVCEFEKTDPFNGQPQELNQIWTHLIHNALQAMDYKGRLTVGLKQTLNEVVVSITDTGHGIPDKIKDRIFEPFFTTRPLGEGGGLGLSIAQKIVTKYLGRIEVQTVPGEGTTFSVHFPLPEKAARAA